MMAMTTNSSMRVKPLLFTRRAKHKPLYFVKYNGCQAAKVFPRGSIAQEFPQHPPARLDDFKAVPLHPPIQFQHPPPVLRQLRAAALVSAAHRFDDGVLETFVHRPDERPGAHVGHAHARSGPADGTGFRDEFQQVRLARPEGDFFSANDAETRMQNGQPGRTVFPFHKLAQTPAVELPPAINGARILRSSIAGQRPTSSRFANEGWTTRPRCDILRV